MAETTSLAWPNMFDVTRNQVTVLEDSRAVSSRVKLLLLTDPTEIYNELEQGVGLRRYLWQYNTENTVAMVKDRIRSQLRQFEPCVDADKTIFQKGLLFTGSKGEADIEQKYQKLEMTMAVITTFGEQVTVETNERDLKGINTTLPDNIFDGSSYI